MERNLRELRLGAARVSFLSLREAALVGLVALAVYLFLAIASYSPNDPGPSVATSDPNVANLVGRSGAWMADIALLVFGWVAYVLPAGLCVAAARTRSRTAPPWSWPLVAVRFFGWCGIAVAACALASLHFAGRPRKDVGAGGAIGDWISAIGMEQLNWAGTTLLAIPVLLICVPPATGLSWLTICEALGKGLHAGAANVVRAAAALAATLRRRSEASERRGPAKRVDPVGAGTLPRQAPAAQDGKALAQGKAAPEVAPAVQREAEKPRRRPPRSRESSRRSQPPSAPLPDLELLERSVEVSASGFSGESLETMSDVLQRKLGDFGIEARVTSVLPGPVVTRFEVQPAAGVKVSRISAVAKDLARELAVVSVRVVEVIPGKSVVGIEIPNEHRAMVRLRQILDSEAFREADSALTMALGKDIAGQPVLADIAKMPHLLIAGTTGSGKSVGVNAMLISMLYKASPEQLRLILVDPKMLELAVYDGIPHLLTPVVTDMKDAAAALNWCVGEMERRYRLMAALGVRNLEGFNGRVAAAEEAGEPIADPLAGEDDAEALDRLPLVLVVIDEFADLMMVVGKKVDQLIARIAQKARAAGIHLVLATQRPSVDVITGLIKSNIPARISYQVSSKLNSRVVLDQGGAEQLLGHGDMLFLPPGTSVPTRVHGAFVSDEEVHGVVADWKARAEPSYLEGLLDGAAVADVPGVLELGDGDGEQSDALYDEAVAFVIDSRRASISAVQRKLRIGYNRAARLVEAMEAAGVVSAMDSNGTREVLLSGGG